MLNTIVDIFSRAQQNKALTPNERAIVKAVKGAGYGVLINVAPQLINMVSTHATFNFSQAVLSGLGGAFVLSLLKLWSAQSDPEVGAVLDALAQQKEMQAMNALTSSTSPDGTMPVWQITIPAVKSTTVKIDAPTAKPSQFQPTVMVPVVKPPSLHDAVTAEVPAVDKPSPM